MEIRNNDELHLLITAAYSDLNQGLEQLRMFDKFMAEIEGIAHVKYDENGNVRFHESDRFGRVQRDGDGEPIKLTHLKETEENNIELNGCKEWLRGRLQNAKWPATHSRKVLQVLERLE